MSKHASLWLRTPALVFGQKYRLRDQTMGKPMQIMVARVLLASLLIAAIPATADEPDPPKQTRITIGKETTFITEPLRPDGYPHYLAALNRRMSEGVTPENNAA